MMHSGNEAPDNEGSDSTEIDWSSKSTTQEIRRETKHGVFLWWSDQTPSWIHPDDSHHVDGLVPGNRIFSRHDCENFADRQLGYSTFRYGNVEFRGLPAIWLVIRAEGYEPNDLVEIKSGFGRLRSGIATITEIKWNRHARVIEYFLMINGRRIERPFVASDFQPAVRLESHLSTREIQLSGRLRIA